MAPVKGNYQQFADIISANQKLMDKFCYLGQGDILNVDGDADAAAEA